MLTLLKKIKNFLIREDNEYVEFVEKHKAKTKKQKAFYLLMHILPGLLSFIAYLFLIEPMKLYFHVDYKYAQLYILLFMTIVWEIGLTFLMLRFVEKLSFKDSLKFLSLNRIDLKGLLIIVPIAYIIYSLLSLPYHTFVYKDISSFLNNISILKIPKWHLLYTGYYNFPILPLILILIGNFLGEEIYHRGYLLKKIGGIKGDWIINSILFQLYHFWQAPSNWPFIPFAIFIPLSLLTKCRKSLYIPMLFHILVNTLH